MSNLNFQLQTTKNNANDNSFIHSNTIHITFIFPSAHFCMVFDVSYKKIN